MVTDLDKQSREDDSFTWKAYLKRGVIHRKANGNFTVEWGKTSTLRTHTATKNRSMELSELVWWNRHLFAFCDMTGIIWKIDPDADKAFQRYAIADGDGDEPKPFKQEWATVKDHVLYVGSVGKELSNRARPAEWVKTIQQSGDIHNVDWGGVYLALRTATNTSYPGYLWHEAVHFDQRNRLWVITPRKESRTAYDEEENQYKGSNLLILANEDFSKITVKRVGPLDPMYGFTTIRKLPGTNGIYIALKVAEYENATHSVQHTMFTVFDTDGNMRLETPSGEPFAHVADLKYEGIEFLNFGTQVHSLGNRGA